MQRPTQRANATPQNGTSSTIPSENNQNHKVKRVKKKRRKKSNVTNYVPVLIACGMIVGVMMYYRYVQQLNDAQRDPWSHKELDDDADFREKRRAEMQERGRRGERPEHFRPERPERHERHDRGDGRGFGGHGGRGEGHERGERRDHGGRHGREDRGDHGGRHEREGRRGHEGDHNRRPGGFPGGGPNGKRRPSRHIPEISEIGDFSDEYREILEKYEGIYPPEDIETRVSSIQKLRKRQYKAKFGEDQIGYDVFNCPDDPPEGYPAQFQTMDIIKDWNPDDVKPREEIYQGICIFNYATEYDKAIRYREAELPFVIRDDPEVLKSVERWNHPKYLKEVLALEDHRAEYSENNHFMYWNGGRRRPTPNGWKEPTKNIRISYDYWLKNANTTDIKKLDKNMPHWYFRLIGCGLMGEHCDKGSSEWLYNDLTFFKPDYVETLYLVEPEEQKGIHCRFGMNGVIAENHFDATRNMIVVLGGERRYILSHPDECENLVLYEKGHPSARHSMIDWSEPDLDKYPIFKNASSNEIVLQAGDVLYLPTYWFHYIISLGVNFQCNTRSGKTDDYVRAMRDCGF